MTFDAGRIITWRLPRFSALKMLRRASLSTDMRTMAAAGCLYESARVMRQRGEWSGGVSGKWWSAQARGRRRQRGGRIPEATSPLYVEKPGLGKVCNAFFSLGGADSLHGEGESGWRPAAVTTQVAGDRRPRPRREIYKYYANGGFDGR